MPPQTPMEPTQQPSSNPQPVPSVVSPPPVTPTQIKPSKSRTLPILIVVIAVLVVIIAVGGWLLLAHKNNPSNTDTSSKASNTKRYINDQLGFSFSYPASWGTVSVTQTNGTQTGQEGQAETSGIASYDAKFSNKDGGEGHPYLFRINSFKYFSTDQTSDITYTYRVVATDQYNETTRLSPGLNYCYRIEDMSEICESFSKLGDWTTINNVIVAKEDYDPMGVAMFAHLKPFDAENYTMASFYSSSASDYDAFKAIAQSFSGQIPQ